MEANGSELKICGLMKTTLLDFPGHVACTVFLGGCNFRCPFCHNAELLPMDIPAEYTEQEIFDFLKKRGVTLEGVAITGGEPTLQKKLPEFIRKIREDYGLKIKLDTNGIDPVMVRKLIDEKQLDYVSMDIKAAPENYAAVCGVKESALHFDRITETKDLLLEGKVPYEFRTTCVGGIHTEADFEAIGVFIEGAEHYFIQAYKNSDRVLNPLAGFTEPKVETLKKYRDIVAPHVKHVEIRGVDIEL